MVICDIIACCVPGKFGEISPAVYLGNLEKYRLLCTWENSENKACCVPGKFGEISPAVYLGKSGEISPAVYLREIEISNS